MVAGRVGCLLRQDGLNVEVAAGFGKSRLMVIMGHRMHGF